MNITRLTLLSIAAALALSGCGNKGPLVLPDTPEEVETPVAADEADGDAALDDTATDGAATDGAEADAAGSMDDTDAPVEPEPLPQDDGDSD